MLTSKKFLIPVALVAIGVIVVLAITLSANRSAPIAIAPQTTPLVLQLPTIPPPTLTTTSVRTQSSGRSIATTVKSTGTLLSAKQATLAFAVGGRVKEIKVEEGDKVKAGALLASIDTGSLDATVAQAQAVFDLAKATFNKVAAGPNADEIAVAKSNVDRARAAVNQAQAAYDRIGGATSPFVAMTAQALALEQATISYQAAVAQYRLAVNHPTEAELSVTGAQLAQAQAALDAAKNALNNAKIVAPFDGTVVSIVPKLGESVATNAPVMTLADLTKMQATVNLDENSLASVKVGQPVMLTVDALGGATLTGRVQNWVAWYCDDRRSQCAGHD